MKDYLDEYIVVTRLLHRNRGASIYELSKALGKTTRAVYMLLNQLETMQFPIWTDKDPENSKIVRYHADSTFMKSLPDLDFTEDDKAVFNYLLSDAGNNPALEVKARHLFTKLKLMAAERGTLVENSSIKQPAIISTSNIAKKVDNRKVASIISRIIEAISNKEWMTISYQNIYSGKSYSYDIYPIVIFSSNGDYYLYCFNIYEKLRMLALERIKEVIAARKDEAPSAKVDIKKLLEDPFGIIYDTDPFKVRILADENEAMFIKQKNWPESVTITENADGSIIFEAETHSYYDCKRWILERIMSITVLEPDWIIEDINETLKAGLERYS